MTLQLGDTAPDFTAQTTRGKIDFHDWLGDSWGLLLSHPRDFTPVCAPLKWASLHASSIDSTSAA